MPHRRGLKPFLTPECTQICPSRGTAARAGKTSHRGSRDGDPVGSAKIGERADDRSRRDAAGASHWYAHRLDGKLYDELRSADHASIESPHRCWEIADDNNPWIHVDTGSGRRTEQEDPSRACCGGQHGSDQHRCRGCDNKVGRWTDRTLRWRRSTHEPSGWFDDDSTVDYEDDTYDYGYYDDYCYPYYGLGYGGYGYDYYDYDYDYASDNNANNRNVDCEFGQQLSGRSNSSAACLISWASIWRDGVRDGLSSESGYLGSDFKANEFCGRLFSVMLRFARLG